VSLSCVLLPCVLRCAVCLLYVYLFYECSPCSCFVSWLSECVLLYLVLSLFGFFYSTRACAGNVDRNKDDDNKPGLLKKSTKYPFGSYIESPQAAGIPKMTWIV
jgi:hypothetical protein